MSVRNPFATDSSAERYSKGRPFHHPRALARVWDVMRDARPALGLDVGCGTGLSTTALAEHCDMVVGVDSAAPMIRVAPRDSNIAYAVATAERLPFGQQSFDLVTVSSAIHWLDQERFFAEAAGVLGHRAWLVIYDHFFEGAPDEPQLNDWLTRTYPQRYPPPRRGPRAGWELLVPADFDEVAAFDYTDPIEFTHSELVSYLLSHSNTLAPTAEGREAVGETRAWLRDQTARWFEGTGRRTFSFRGSVHCLRRKD